MLIETSVRDSYQLAIEMAFVLALLGPCHKHAGLPRWIEGKGRTPYLRTRP